MIGWRAVVGPGMRARRAERHAVLGGEREHPPAALALAGDRVGEVRARAGDHLDLRGDQLARDRLREPRVGVRGRAQLLVARHEFERLGVEDRELLLDPHRQVHRLGEALLGPV